MCTVKERTIPNEEVFTNIYAPLYDRREFWGAREDRNMAKI